MHQIIDEYKNTKPILGVCLGHQSIAEFFGATLINMPEVNHGREFATEIINQDYIFNDILRSFLRQDIIRGLLTEKTFRNHLKLLRKTKSLTTLCL